MPHSSFQPQAAQLPTATGKAIARRYHIHSALVTYCLVALLMSIGAFNSNNNLLFWLFFLSLAMVIVSGFISGAMLMSVRVEREVVPDAVAGGSVHIRYRVSNVGRWAPLFAATVTESPSAIAETASGIAGRDSGAAPGGAPAPGQFDRPPVAFATHAAAGSTVEVDAPVALSARGLIQLDEIVLTSDFPFGIVHKSVRFSQPTQMVVRPRPIMPDESMFQTRLSSGIDDASPDRRSGAGEHFFALREYHPGDNPRSIAWRASARAAESAHSGLLVRQTTAARPRNVVVLLNLSQARDAAAYEHAISRAAGAVLHGEKSGIQIGLTVLMRAPGGGVRQTHVAEPRSGRWHVSRLLNELGLLPVFVPGGGAGGDAAGPATPHGREVLVIAADQGGVV